MEVAKFVNGENSPPPREVKAAMHLLLRLQLRKDTNDHLLHEIVSCPGGNLKNIGHVNKNFVQAFISMLNFNLTFNDFTYHSRPPSTADSSFRDRCTKLLKHNCEILLHYLKSTDLAMFDKLKEVTILTSIEKIMESRRNYVNMMKRGLRISMSKSEIKSPLWIHLAFLLQFICPNVNSTLKTQITSNDDGCWSKFMTILTLRQATRGDAELNIVAWKGRYDYQDEEIATRSSGRTSLHTSHSQSSSASTQNATKKKPERRMEEIEIIHAVDNRLVPHDFGLKRSSSRGDNFTYGIAYYDAIERSDPFLCKDYVTDLFQRLYHAEVSNNEYCDCAHRKISRILYFCCRLQATRSPT